MAEQGSDLEQEMAEVQRLLKLLSHPLRSHILTQVKDAGGKGISPSIIAENLDESLGNISYHVRILNDADVLELLETIPRRGAVEHVYVLGKNGDTLLKLRTAVRRVMKKVKAT